LFDQSMVALRFEVEGEALPLEPVLNLFVSKDEGRRRAGAEAIARTLSGIIRLVTLITNTLAKEKEISDRYF